MFKTFALTATLLSVTAVSPATPQDLSGAQLTQLASGHQFMGLNETGETYRACFQPDHLLVGLSNNHRGLQRDTGAWAVQDGQLCMKWISWRHGQEHCAKIKEENGSYMWTSGYAAGKTFEVSACPG